MDHHETTSQQNIEISQAVPGSLLSGVMKRLEERRTYLSDERTVAELLGALADPRWDIRSAAVHTLGTLGEQVPLAALLPALYDEHYLVRVSALRALGPQGRRVPLAQLVLALNDPEWEVREMAVIVLSEMGKEAPDLLLDLLRAAQHDVHSHVRAAATDAFIRHELSSVPTAPNVAVEYTQVAKSMHAQRSYVQMLLHFCLLFKRQMGLIHKSIWVCTPLFLLVWGVITLRFTLFVHGDIQAARLFLAVFTTIISASGTAFIYGSEHDAGLELTLATPTSIRIVMFCRFLLVLGYNIALTAVVSAALALAHGGGWWEIMQLWLGPMIFLSALTLALSLFVGTWVSFCVAFVVEGSQTLALNMDKHWPTLDFSISSDWHTSPVILLLALSLFVFTLFYMPRQPQLATLSS